MKINNQLVERQGFQQVILEYMTNNNQFERGYNKDYDRVFAIDRKMFFKFLESTHEKQLSKLKDFYGESYKEKILRRIDEEITKRGLLDCLKYPIKDMGQEFNLMFKKPVSTLNQDALDMYNKNIFSITEEVVYKVKDDGTEGGRVDLVIFLNGIALISIELKANTSGQSVEDAVRQYKKTRDGKEKLFKFKERSLVNFAVDLEQVYMTTKLVGEKTFFLPFNKGYKNGKGNPPVEDKVSTSYLWEEILTKERLSDLFENFVYLERKKETNSEGKTRFKETIIFPRYHQMEVVNSIVDDVLINGTTKNYLVEHSAGSGKSNSIAWLSHRLVSVHDQNNNNIIDTIIVITDRVVVDRQLQDVIMGIEHKGDVVKVMGDSTSSQDLADALNDNTKIIVSTIQKFRYILDKIGKLKDKKFAIIIDEAHSSTSGSNMAAVSTVLSTDEIRPLDEIDELDGQDLINISIEDEIKRSGKQSNVAMFAFTATPKATTLQKFGVKGADGKYRAFHLYSMKQAIEEGFILDVLKNYTTYETYYKVNKKVEDDPLIKSRYGKQAILRFARIHDTNISQKIEIIIEHFKNNVMYKIGGHAKAMVITDSRLAAVKYKRAFDQYIKDKNYQNIKALVAFTGKVYYSDLDLEFTEVSMNEGIKEKDLPKKFDTDEYQVLLVADKYQTGFDQPLLQALYVDNKLKGVKAVQTLSRLNRVHPLKEDTFVLDFRNTYEDIVKSFEPYYISTELIKEVSPNDVYTLERTIDDYFILKEDETDKFISLIYGNEKLTSAQKQSAYALVGKSKARVDEFDKLKQYDIKSTLLRFIRFYSWLIQVSRFEDVKLHKKFIFIKYLVKAINIFEDNSNVDISDKIAIDNFKQVKKDEKTGSNINSKPELGLPAAKPKTREEERKEKLSEIISEINTYFSKDFDEDITAHSIEQIYEILKKSEELKKRALNNDNIKDFEYALDKEFINSLLRGSNEAQELYMLLLDNEDARRKIRDFLINDVYSDLRK